MEDGSKLSVNNMVELAMGLSMASLFAQAMNATFQNNARMLGNNEVAVPPKYIYAIIDGQQQGPFSQGEVMQLIRDEKVTLETYIWKAGMPEWKPAKEVTDITPGLEQTPVSIPNL